MFGIESIYWVLINSVVSFAYLFIISKILGKKQIAQLEFIDYAIGISLGSIAAEMATDSKTPFYYYLIAMTIFLVLALLVSVVGRKSALLKRILKGKPSTLIYEGKIDYKQLVKCNIDVNDLLSMLREKNYFDVNDVAYAIFEPSGELSVLPKGNQKPVVIEDVNRDAIEKASLTNIMIADGAISESGLSEANKTNEWLFQRLQIKDKSDLKNIILAVYDDKTDKFTVHYKNQ
ncbi:MAG: DUF421 domain-containing protein [Bacteroides sp.]|nr:DUF421 domain-containing protein [Bacillota bacterium]MCM1393284.1 DUF421 domain-containing protein [[Eubacterium] siraeum]MCM1455413.1 DUF421 domain-containing protein [Bacteroides sp.]